MNNEKLTAVRTALESANKDLLKGEFDGEIKALTEVIEAAQPEQEPVAHCEAGPEFCPVCWAETRSLALAAAVGYIQRNTPTLVWTEICNALTTTPPAAQPAPVRLAASKEKIPKTKIDWVFLLEHRFGFGALSQRDIDIAVEVERMVNFTTPPAQPSLQTTAATLQEACHGAAKQAGWWEDIKTGESIAANPYCFSNKLMLVVSELAEAMEGDGKGLKDDKLPHRAMREVELADAVIRIFDLAGAYDMDLGGAISEKMAFNAQRADHKIENRSADGGKAY